MPLGKTDKDILYMMVVKKGEMIRNQWKKKNKKNYADLSKQFFSVSALGIGGPRRSSLVHL